MTTDDYKELFPRLPKNVRIGEVTVRDGFQNEEKWISTEAKIYYLSELIFAGLKDIEVTNLGKPHIMPQFQDADVMLKHVRSDFFKNRCRRKGIYYNDVCFTAVTIREDAVDKAIEFKEKGYGPDRVLMMISTDEEHHFVNAGTTLNEYWKEAERCVKKCNDAGIKVCGTVSTIWGSPVTGPTEIEDAYEFTKRWLDMGVADVEHSDHDGSGTAPEIYRYFSNILDRFPDTDLHVAHFHETKRIGSASVLASLQAGIKRFEGSLGGLGGQPANFFENHPVSGTGRYYHISPGIIPLEDLLVQIDEMGITHGCDIDKILLLGRQMERTIGRTLRSNAAHNGRTMRGGNLALGRPGLQERKKKLGEI